MSSSEPPIERQVRSLALLKEIAPGATHAVVLRDPSTAVGIGQLGAIQAIAPSLGIELSSLDVRNQNALEGAIAEFARAPNGGVSRQVLVSF
jgi:putative ABC transport system substrate-binding protein